MGKKHKKHYRDDRDGDDSGPENPDSPQPQKARKYRSELWNYFEETPSGAAKCQLCGEIVFRNKGSTCNMLGHMRKLHSENKFSSSRKVKLKPEDMGETKQLLQLDRLEKQMAIVYADTTGKYRPVLDDEKSLRVVLKLPQEQITKAMSIKEETVYDEFGEIKRHKHKKKKKKHKHDKERKERKRMHDEIDDDEGSINEDGYDSFIESNPKKALFDSSCGSDVPPINKNVTQSEKIRSLEKCLLYIQLHIQRKDINGFFAFPVSDEIAPGYSSIIDIPMDFSLMKAKKKKVPTATLR